MLDGDILHPLNVGHVVDVSVLVNDGGRDRDGFGVGGGEGHGRKCTLSRRQVVPRVVK